MEIVVHVFSGVEESLKISDCTLCLWFIYSDSLWFTLNIQGYSWTKAFGPSSETTMSRQQKAKKEQRRTKCTNRRTSNRTFRFTRRTILWEFRCSVFTVHQLSFSVQTFWLNWHVFHVFHVHSRSQTLKNVTHVVTCKVDFLSVYGHGFPFSIFLFPHVELQPCHTMCMSLQGTTAVRRQKHHRLEHRLPWFRRCEPKKWGPTYWWMIVASLLAIGYPSSGQVFWTSFSLIFHSLLN